jgi:putative transposase
VKSDLLPYWNEKAALMSAALATPLELASAPSVEGKQLQGSWFHSNLQELKGPAKIKFVVPLVGNEEATRTRKIRIYPTAQQRETFREWLRVSRFVYNESVARLKVHVGPTPHWQGPFGKELLDALPEWADITPYQVKKIAIRDSLTSLSEGKKRVKQGIIPRFQLSFRSRKEPMQSCYIPSSAVHHGGIYPRLSGGEVLKAEDVVDQPLDSRLIYYRNKWYLSVPRKVQRNVAENQGRVVAIDPGVRNFATLFSEAIFGQIGQGDIGRISNLCRYLDSLTARSRNSSILRATNRMRDKITNLVTELHYKVAKYIVTNFDVILLPHFETSEMVVKKARKIRSKTVRQMLTLSHYKFAQRLVDKAWEHGKTVIRCSEAYTSKTNPWTGVINPKLGGAKIIMVHGIAVDRDLCGARGIFLRALRDTSFEAIGLFASEPC